MNADASAPLTEQNREQTPKAYQKYLTLCAFLLVVFTASGIFYGFNSLRPLFEEDGAFSWLCTEAELEKTGSCVRQKNEITAVFSYGITATVLATLLMGSTVDFLGPRIGAFLAECCVAVGLVCLAVASKDASAFYYIGAVMLGAVATAPMLAAFSISTLFEGSAGTVTSLISGTFDASSAAFLIAAKIFTAASISLRAGLLGYAALVLVGVGALVLFAYPRKVFTAPSPTSASTGGDGGELVAPVEGDVRGGEGGEGVTRSTSEAETGLIVMERGEGEKKAQSEEGETEASPRVVTNISSDSPSSKIRTLGTILISWRFLLFSIFWVIIYLRFSFYLATVSQQVDAMGMAELADGFNLVLPFGCLSVPIFGAVLDRFGIPTAGLVLNILGVTSSALALVGVGWVQWAHFVLFSCYRSALFAFFYCWLGLNFGYQFLGLLAGVVSLAGGLIQFANPSVNEWVNAEDALSRYQVVNWVFLCLGLLSFGYVGVLFWESGRERSSRNVQG